MPDSQLQIREATDADSPQLIALIAGVFAEYPGCVLDVEGEEPDLLAIATAFAQKPGKFWVARQRGQVVGSLGLVFHAGYAELKKVYVRRPERRSGIARTLLEGAVSQVRAHRLGRLVAWSDSRFVEAHHFYEQHGFRRGPETRELNDLSDSVEFAFELDLARFSSASRMP
ncbi:MAG: hypothetical protein RJA70_4279 [Pseudomonadota bacterium]